MAPHSSTLAWEIPWTEEPGKLQSMGSLRVGHDWATSLSLFIFMHWRRKWQPTPVFLPGESQGWEPGRLPSMGSHRVGHDWPDLGAAAAWVKWGFPCGSNSKESTCNAGDLILQLLSLTLPSYFFLLISTKLNYQNQSLKFNNRLQSLVDLILRWTGWSLSLSSADGWYGRIWHTQIPERILQFLTNCVVLLGLRETGSDYCSETDPTIILFFLESIAVWIIHAVTGLVVYSLSLIRLYTP